MATVNVETYDSTGKLIATTTATVTQASVNAQTLHDRMVTALGTNATYLGLANPTTAQNTAQVKALTRQVDGLIRLLVTEDTNVITDS